MNKQRLIKRIEENLEDMEDVLKHNWLIHSYISKYGYVSEDAPENTLKAYNNAIEIVRKGGVE